MGVIFKAGLSSPSINLFVFDNAGAPVTGKVAADFPTLNYSINGANNATSFPALSDLANENSTYSSGGVKERAGGAGAYRVDVPAAAVATAGTIVDIFGYASNFNIVCPQIEVLQITTAGLLDVNLVNWKGSAPNDLLQGRVEVQDYIVRANVIQSSSGVNIVLDTGADATHDHKYRYQWIMFLTGSAAGECDQIVGYTASSRTATVIKGFVGTPTTDDIYVITPQAPTSINWQTVFGQSTNVNLSNTVVGANLIQILGTALTETVGGYLAAGFKKLYDVAAPIFTLASFNQGADNNTILTNLNTRLTAARAGYLDNLNVGGPVASQADVLAINTSSSKHVILQTVAQFERPESSTVTYTVEARTYSASTGDPVDADSTPTLAAVGSITGSLSGNLSAASHPTTGLYRWTYTVSSTDTIEQIRFDVSATISSTARTLSCYTQTADFVASTWTTTDRANLVSALSHATAADTQTAAAAIRTAVGLGSANLDSQLSALPASTATATAAAMFVDGSTNKLKVNADHTADANVKSFDEASLDAIMLAFEGAVVTVSGPIAGSQSSGYVATFAVGDDYLASDNRAASFSVSNDDLPDLSGATCQLICKLPRRPQVAFDGTIAADGSDWVFTFEPVSTETVLLGPVDDGQALYGTFWIRILVDGRKISPTQLRGQLIVNPGTSDDEVDP